jgi:hypothetical protein
VTKTYDVFSSFLPCHPLLHWRIRSKKTATILTILRCEIICISGTKRVNLKNKINELETIQESKYQKAFR